MSMNNTARHQSSKHLDENPETLISGDARQLNILEMCTKFGVGGIARHAIELGAWMRQRGHNVTFAGTPGEWLNPDIESEFVTLRTHEAAGENPNMVSRIGNVARSAHMLRSWLAKNPVDVIHTHESAPALTALLASIGMQIPVIVTYHGSEPERIGQFGSIAKHTDLVVTPSHRTAQDLAKIGGVPAKKLSVIGLGVKPAPVFDAQRISDLRQELLGDGGEHLVVTIARITEQKGIDILINCVKTMMQTHPNYRFVVVGDGPQEAEAHQWVQEAGVSDHIKLVGRSEEPHLYLRAADLFLLTSRWEALPFTIAEAFQTGTPCVATDCGGVEELIDDKVGRVVPIGDVPAICTAVTEILENETLRKSMADAALVRCREDRFSPEHIYQKFESVYLTLAD